jgi:hypothetical protein
MPAASGVSAYAGDSQLVALADGVAAVLNGLRPGVSAVLAFHYSGANFSLRLVGNLVVASAGPTQVWRSCRWNLPAATLSSDVAYTVEVFGGSVVVKQSV